MSRERKGEWWRAASRSGYRKVKEGNEPVRSGGVPRKGDADGKKEVADSVGRVRESGDRLTRKLKSQGGSSPVPSTQRRERKTPQRGVYGLCEEYISVGSTVGQASVSTSVCMGMGMEATTTADETDERGPRRSASRRDWQEGRRAMSTFAG